MDQTVQRKATVRTILRHALVEQDLDEAVLSLDGNMAQMEERVCSAAAEDGGRRRASNRRITVQFIGPLVLLLSVALVGLMAYNRHHNRTFALAHWFGLVLVLFVYVFEVLFFLLVVEHYIMVGDMDLLRAVPEGRERFTTTTLPLMATGHGSPLTVTTTTDRGMRGHSAMRSRRHGARHQNPLGGRGFWTQTNGEHDPSQCARTASGAHSQRLQPGKDPRFRQGLEEDGHHRPEVGMIHNLRMHRGRGG